MPVSSSGHLSLFQYFSHAIEENLTLNIAVHMGTLLTVVVYYRKDISSLFMGLLRRQQESVQMFALIVCASLPTGVIGLLMKKKMDWVLTHPLVAGVCLGITGLILQLPKKKASPFDFDMRPGFGISFPTAFIIGIVQGLAVLPGISRSGSTIVAGLLLGMSPSNASRFSFLISIPAILAAGLLELKDGTHSLNLSDLTIGFAVSFVTGLLAISWMVRLTAKRQFRVFSYYALTISVLSVTLYLLGLGRGIL